MQLSRGDRVYTIEKDVDWNFYWIGPGRDDISGQKIAGALAKQPQNTVQALTGESGSILVVRAGPYQFGELIDVTD
jgi:hypothetical protein